MEGAGSGNRIEPRLSEQLVQFIERLKSDTHHGESFELTLSESELEEALEWYASEHAGFPLGKALVSIRREGIEISGEARVGTLRVPVSARADVWLNEGMPLIALDQLQLGETGLPDAVRFQLEDQLNSFLALRGGELPVLIDEMELFDGWLNVGGSIR